MDALVQFMTQVIRQAQSSGDNDVIRRLLNPAGCLTGLDVIAGVLWSLPQHGLRRRFHCPH
jgi:hypothetical protein